MSTVIDLGRIIANPAGAYSAESSYEVLDLVYDGGKLYECIKDAPAGTSLDNTEYYRLTFEYVITFSADTPLMNGAGSAGTSDYPARLDHVHPSDTGKANLSGGKVAAAEASADIVSVTESKTLALTDAGKFLNVNSSSAVVLTVPPNASVAFPVGTEIEIYRKGAGTVQIAAGSGVTLESIGTYIAAQYAGAGLKQTAANVWALTGYLST